MDANIILDAAEPLNEVAKGLDELDVVFGGLNIRYDTRQLAVRIDLAGAAARNAEVVWELLILEFSHAGWGFNTRFDNGLDQPRTSMKFTHPITLTRVR